MIDTLLDNAARRAHLVFAAFVGVTAASALAVVAVDVYDLGGLRSWYAGEELVPFFWFHWYEFPLEKIGQWGALGAFVAVCVVNSVLTHHRSDSEGRTMWMLLTVGGVLMLLEDAFDIRHELRVAINPLVGEESYGVVSTFVELGYFAAIGVVLVWALVRYRHYWSSWVPTRGYLLVGYMFYGAAVGCSWLGSAFRDYEPAGHRDLYTLIGEAVTSRLFALDDQALRLFVDTTAALEQTEMAPLPFYFVDRVFEESLELIGAGALLVAALAFWGQYRDQSGSHTREA